MILLYLAQKPKKCIVYIHIQKEISGTSIDILHSSNVFRMIYDAEESECMDADIKCKIQDLTLEMPNLPYDIRISVSSEIAVDPTTVQLPTDTLPERRVKTRWSFENNAMLWKIELTRVISQDQTIYEVEFELTEDTVQICKMGETANITQLATKFFLVMVNYMSKLPSKESKHTEFANLSMIKVDLSNVTNFNRNFR